METFISTKRKLPQFLVKVANKEIKKSKRKQEPSVNKSQHTRLLTEG